MTSLQKEVFDAVKKVWDAKPLVCSITNYVTVNFVANAQLACGGLAAMVYNSDEAENLIKAGASVYINLGTLLPFHKDSMLHAAKLCADSGHPFVLDPVAIGLGSLRTEIAMALKQYKPSIIRGNASEIIALAKMWNLFSEDKKGNVHGVESTDKVDDAKDAAIALALYTGGAAAVSGPVDLITDGNEVVRLSGGSPIMERVTGSGCSLGGVMAVYACVAKPFVAAVAASALYKLSGSRAAFKSEGPGRFYVNFIDGLSSASAEDIAGELQ